MTTESNPAQVLANLAGLIAMRQSYVIYYQTRILAGVYKDRQVVRGDGTKLSEEELLEDEMQTMLQHIRIIADLTDAMIAT